MRCWRDGWKILAYALAVIVTTVARAWQADGSPLWPNGAVTVRVHLNDSQTLSDGSTFAGSVRAAMQDWNQSLDRIQFSATDGGGTFPGPRNGANNIWLDQAVMGTPFGQNVLAVTLTFTSGSARTECDIIFNQTKTWDSYRGSAQFNAADARRVALHELGHVLGLNHPDEAGQFRTAIMNSIAGVPALTFDDRWGASTLYGVRGDGVGVLPQLSTLPSGQTLEAGEPFGLDVSVSNPSDFSPSLQWYKDGVAITGENGRIFSRGNVTPADAGIYTLVARNEAGAKTSTPFLLTVAPASPPLAYVAGAEVITLNQNDPLNLTFRLEGTRPKTYVIRRDGVVVQEGISYEKVGFASLSQLASGPLDTGNYTVTVTNMAGSATSNPLSVVVRSAVPPWFAAQPASAAAYRNSATVFFATVKGTEPFTYRWERVGVVKGNSSSLYIPIVVAGDEGDYTLTVSNAAGEIRSNPVRLTIVDAAQSLRPPVILRQPASLRLGSRQNASLEVIPLDPTGVTYQWKKDGVVMEDITSSSLYFPGLLTVPEGIYTVTLTSPWGTVTSEPASVTAAPGLSTAPIIRQPVGQIVVGGTTFNLNVETGLTGAQFQWRKDGAPIAGATLPILTLANVLAADSGKYTVDVIHSSGMTPSQEADVRVIPTGRLINLASRARAGVGEDVLVMGFTVAGTTPKSLLVRGIGPTLRDFGVNDPLPNPQLTLVKTNGEFVRFINDANDFGTGGQIDAVARRVGAFSLPTFTQDSAMLVDLPPGGYTAVLTNFGVAASGIALIELYDISATTARLVNLSTRTRVYPGEGALVAGITVDGPYPKKLLVRAAGPALKEFGLTDTLTDPKLEIFAMSSNQVVASNDDWFSSNGQGIADTANSVGAFAFKSGSLDAAAVVTLPPGGYTAVVSGKSNASGVALVEVYEVDR